MSKRELILAALQEGPKTTEQLYKIASTEAKGLASQFSYLRLMGFYPRKCEDGLVRLISKEEFEASKGARSGNSSKPAKTPGEALEAARKREGRAQSALDNAKKKYEADKKDKLNKLYLERAQADASIAALLVHQAEEACKTAGIDPNAVLDAPAPNVDVEAADAELAEDPLV